MTFLEDILLDANGSPYTQDLDSIEERNCFPKRRSLIICRAGSLEAARGLLGAAAQGPRWGCCSGVFSRLLGAALGLLLWCCFGAAALAPCAGPGRRPPAHVNAHAPNESAHAKAHENAHANAHENFLIVL